MQGACLDDLHLGHVPLAVSSALLLPQSYIQGWSGDTHV